MNFLRFAVVFSSACFVLGCNHPSNEAEATKQLSGRWLLNTQRDCSYGPVESDELLLLPDGRLEQHLKLKDGRTFQSTSERWFYSPKTNVDLESRWTYPADAKTPTKESESLIVEFGKSPVIVIDPDSNCFYMKVE